MHLPVPGCGVCSEGDPCDDGDPCTKDVCALVGPSGQRVCDHAPTCGAPVPAPCDASAPVCHNGISGCTTKLCLPFAAEDGGDAWAKINTVGIVDQYFTQPILCPGPPSWAYTCDTDAGCLPEARCVPPLSDLAGYFSVGGTFDSPEEPLTCVPRVLLSDPAGMAPPAPLVVFAPDPALDLDGLPSCAEPAAPAPAPVAVQAPCLRPVGERKGDEWVRDVIPDGAGGWRAVLPMVKIEYAVDGYCYEGGDNDASWVRVVVTSPSLAQRHGGLYMNIASWFTPSAPLYVAAAVRPDQTMVLIVRYAVVPKGARIVARALDVHGEVECEAAIAADAPEQTGGSAVALDGGLVATAWNQADGGHLVIADPCAGPVRHWTLPGKLAGRLALGPDGRLLVPVEANGGVAVVAVDEAGAEELVRLAGVVGDVALAGRGGATWVVADGACGDARVAAIRLDSEAPVALLPTGLPAARLSADVAPDGGVVVGRHGSDDDATTIDRLAPSGESVWSTTLADTGFGVVALATGGAALAGVSRPIPVAEIPTDRRNVWGVVLGEDGTLPGACLPGGLPGDRCGGDLPPCADGTLCSVGAGSVCAAPALPDTLCTTDAECAAPATCGVHLGYWYESELSWELTLCNTDCGVCGAVDCPKVKRCVLPQPEGSERGSGIVCAEGLSCTPDSTNWPWPEACKP